jgi:hypothetical protein
LFEYKTVDIRYYDKPSHHERLADDALNAAASEGWRVIAAVPRQYGVFYTLERVKAGPNPHVDTHVAYETQR